MSGAKDLNQFVDDNFEYRNVKVSDAAFEEMPKGRLLTEQEWRGLGVKLGRGWEHYEIYSREPNILMMRRKLEMTSAGPASEVKK